MFQRIPSVQELLESAPLKNLVEQANRAAVVSGVRSFVDRLTRAAQTAAEDFQVPSPTELAQRVADWINAERERGIRPVINATGVVLCDALGGAPLAADVVAQTAASGDNYASYGMDLANGRPVDRTALVTRLLAERAGAEDALIVANLPAAVMTAASAHAGYRTPFALLSHISDAKRRMDRWFECLSDGPLAGVGSVNAVSLDEIQAVLGDAPLADEDGGVFLWAPPVSFRLQGQVALPSLSEVAGVCRETGVTLIAIPPLATLTDPTRWGLAKAFCVAATLSAGADLVIFAGDGLIGGPPCGLMVGRKAAIEPVRSHPLLEAFPPATHDLAGLEAALRLHADADTAGQNIPAVSLLTAPADNLKLRAERMAEQLAAADWVESAAAVQTPGWLSDHRLPGEEIAGWGVRLTAKPELHDLYDWLRRRRPAIVTDTTCDSCPSDASDPAAKRTVTLNLRSVLARQDVTLTELLEDLRPSEERRQDEHGE